MTGEVKEIFSQIATIQEVFEAERVCGICAANIGFRVREHDGNKFYELVCMNRSCRAVFAFGQHRSENSLFPKRKDAAGALPNGGWARFDGSKKPTTK